MDAARRRPLLRKSLPGHRRGVLRGGPVDVGRCGEGPRRRPRRRTGVGQDRRRRAGVTAQPDRRPDRDESGAGRTGGVLGQRQADPRDAQRRHPVGGGSLPLLRGGHPGPGGIAEPDRRRHRRLPLPRAARRGRPDHPLELPDPDGGLEARSRAGRRQRRGAQTGRADAGLGDVPDLTDRRSAAAGRGQRGQRVRCGSRQAAGLQ